MTTSYLLDTDGHLIEAHFELEGIDEIFTGFHNPNRTWNGWACPYFTREVAQQITRALDGFWDDKFDRGIILPRPITEYPMAPARMSEDDIYDLEGWTIFPEAVSFSHDGPVNLWTTSGICWMTTDEPSEAEQWVTRMADAIRAEILQLMRDGVIPLNVHVREKDGTLVHPFATMEHPYGPFSRLHDYVDANMLGWDEVGQTMWDARANKDEDGVEQGDATDILNVATQRVDRWLSYGGHLWCAEDERSPVTDPDTTFQALAYYGDQYRGELVAQGDDPRAVWEAARASSFRSGEEFRRHITVKIW